MNYSFVYYFLQKKDNKEKSNILLNDIFAFNIKFSPYTKICEREFKNEENNDDEKEYNWKIYHKNIYVYKKDPVSYYNKAICCSTLIEKKIWLFKSAEMGYKPAVENLYVLSDITRDYNNEENEIKSLINRDDYNNMNNPMYWINLIDSNIYFDKMFKLACTKRRNNNKQDVYTIMIKMASLGSLKAMEVIYDNKKGYYSDLYDDIFDHESDNVNFMYLKILIMNKIMINCSNLNELMKKYFAYSNLILKLSNYNNDYILPDIVLLNPLNRYVIATYFINIFSIYLELELESTPNVIEILVTYIV